MHPLRAGCRCGRWRARRGLPLGGGSEGKERGNEGRKSARGNAVRVEGVKLPAGKTGSLRNLSEALKKSEARG